MKSDNSRGLFYIYRLKHPVFGESADGKMLTLKTAGGFLAKKYSAYS